MERPDLIVLTTSYNQKKQVFTLLENLNRHIDLNMLMVVAESGVDWSCEGVEVLHIGNSNFWTGAVTEALSFYCENYYGVPILICNCDVSIISFDIAKYISCSVPVAAYTKDVGGIKKSGFKFSPWYLGSNHYNSVYRTELDNLYVDVAPCRMIFFSNSSLENLPKRLFELMPDRTFLPHYGADYVFTANISKHAGPILLAKDFIIVEDISTTGIKNLKTWKDRLDSISNIKSPFHFIFYVRTVIMLSEVNPYSRVPYIILAIIKYFVRFVYGK